MDTGGFYFRLLCRRLDDWALVGTQVGEPSSALNDGIAELRQFIANGRFPSMEDAARLILLALDVDSRYRIAADGILEIPLHLSRGIKTLESAEEGHARTHGTWDEKQARWAAYQADFDAARQAHPRWSKERCYSSVAIKHKVNPRTIKRHVRDPKPE